MADQTGNKYGTKLKDPEVRQEAYRQFCAHVATGKPIQSFFFKHPEYSVSYKTMLRYIKESPEEFPSLLMEEAQAKKLDYFWEQGIMIMQGRLKHGSPVVWQTFMRNIYRNTELAWDRQELEVQGQTADFTAGFKNVIETICQAQKLVQAPEPVIQKVPEAATDQALLTP